MVELYSPRCLPFARLEGSESLLMKVCPTEQELALIIYILKKDKRVRKRYWNFWRFVLNGKTGVSLLYVICDNQYWHN